MKKIMAVISIILFPMFVFAKEYEVKDINIKLDIRDDFIVITRDNLENNTDLVRLNISKEYMEKLMDEKNVYLDIIKNDVSYEILVVVPKTELKLYNMDNFTDEMLNDYKDKIVEKNGAGLSGIYKAKHNYIYVDYYDSDSGYYMVNYYTIANARGYNFLLQKKSEITDDEKEDLKEIIDSVSVKIFDEYKNESEEMQKNIDNYNRESFNYMNVVYGVIIGTIVGLISYAIGVNMKKKSSV